MFNSSVSRTPSRRSAPRLRRAAITAMLAAALTVTGLAPLAVPATATPTAPASPTISRVSGLIVVPGRDRVTASWSAVGGATSYQVRVSTKSKLVKTVTTTRTTAVVSKLRKSTTYYVQVIAIPTEAASASARVKTKTSSATTGRGQITSIAADGVNTIKVNWKRFPRATSIDIRLSWDNTPLIKAQKGRYVQFSGYPATTTSATLRIPSAYVSMIGSTSGNPVYVRLISHNGSKSRTSKVRVGWPSGLSAAGTQVKVATYNMMSSTARPATGSLSWGAKRGAVANTVALANPDVLLVQEVIPNPAYPATSNTYTQLEDVARLMAAQGLTPAYSVDRVMSTRVGSRGNHIFVRTTNIEVLDSGLIASSDLVSADWSKLENRYFAWAKLRVRATGETFYAVSVHLLSQSAGKSLRLALTRTLMAYIDKMNSANVPVVMGGDFNVGFLGPYNQDAPDVIRAAGYIDAASATRRAGAIYSTSNTGMPSKPKPYVYVGTRIDYLFVKNTNGAGASTYVNQVKLNSNGTFNGTYYGSDHNLQWATISLGTGKA